MTHTLTLPSPTELDEMFRDADVLEPQAFQPVITTEDINEDDETSEV
ncbi:hypothetical protein AB0O01_00995 [Streptomyces sp. NPDC093252]